MSQKQLTHLTEGMPLIYGGNKYIPVTAQLAAEFQTGDSIIVVESTGTPLIIPKKEKEIVAKCVHSAQEAGRKLNQIPLSQIDQFYQYFAENLSNDTIWKSIQTINDQDIARAQQNGKSTTRLIANEKCRQSMIAGLHDQLNGSSSRGTIAQSLQHEGWHVDLIKSEMGVIGFVFEGRPNVLADATGVLKSGNTVVFRIGQDALKTAQSIMKEALIPALKKAGLPIDVVKLIESRSRAAGWALFSNTDISLLVARGSGEAVRTLGGLANQHGIPVSLHGTGGAWMIVAADAPASILQGAIYGSLDRKVCNTLNVITVERSASKTQIPLILKALEKASKTLGHPYKLHVLKGCEDVIPDTLKKSKISVVRPKGTQIEDQIESIEIHNLGQEWEWEKNPEVTLVIVDHIHDAISLYNQYSPQFIVSTISASKELENEVFSQVNAPFFCNGMTRWVDGQYALNCPELGLSNWENGRLLGRNCVLSGHSVYTLRTRMHQQKAELRR